MFDMCSFDCLELVREIPFDCAKIHLRTILGLPTLDQAAFSPDTFNRGNTSTLLPANYVMNYEDERTLC